jgi:hypothetical protein
VMCLHARLWLLRCAGRGHHRQELVLLAGGTCAAPEVTEMHGPLQVLCRVPRGDAALRTREGYAVGHSARSRVMWCCSNGRSSGVGSSRSTPTAWPGGTIKKANRFRLRQSRAWIAMKVAVDLSGP